MKKISLDSWVQLIGMLSVVAGLVFVGLEMQQSQKIALAGQQANRVQLFSSMMDANNEQGIDQQKLQMILSGQIPMTEDYEWVVMNGLHRMWWIYENDFLFLCVDNERNQFIYKLNVTIEIRKNKINKNHFTC